MKTNFYALIIFLSTLNFAFAQDGVFWAYNIKFKIETNNTYEYEYEKAELFINEPYNFKNYRGSQLEYASSTNEYFLQLNYSCISCGSKFSQPIALYLKVDLKYKFSHNTKFSILIPIYFKKLNNTDFEQTDQFQMYIDIGSIDYRDFIKNDATAKPYTFIDVDKDLSIKKSRKNQLQPISQLILINSYLKQIN
jgi:hypothetical protein